MAYTFFTKFGIGLILSFLTYPVLGQTKFEKEYRVNTSEIPKAAINFFNPIEVPRKIKWFYEENLLGNSVEAKFKLNHHKYSVEFDTLGYIQDVEIKISKKEIPTPPWNTIRNNFSTLFTHWKIQKIQIQYSGPTPILQALVQSKKAPPGLTTKYEIVVRGRTDQNDRLHEFLFSDNGKLLERAIIKLRNTDHLEY